MSRVLMIVCVALALGAGARAQVETRIVTDGTVPFAGGTRPRIQRLEVAPGPGRVFEIRESLGFRPGGPLGTNLFHSFERFDVGEGDTALFTSPFATRNLIGRVTGGEASRIFGTLRSEIPGADLWLLNPAGVIFGPRASLQLPASFYGASADHLLFESMGRFDAANPAADVLTSAAPSAFGFLADPAGAGAGIEVQESPGFSLEGVSGSTIALVGEDVRVGPSRRPPTPPGTFRPPVPRIVVPEGRIVAVALGDSGGNVDVNGAGPPVVTGTAPGGRLEQAGWLRADDGAVHLTGGQVDVDSEVWAPSGEISVSGDAVRVGTTGFLDSDGGRIEVVGGTVEVEGGLSVGFTAAANALIRIAGDRVTIGPDSIITGIDSVIEVRATDSIEIDGFVQAAGSLIDVEGDRVTIGESAYIADDSGVIDAGLFRRIRVDGRIIEIAGVLRSVAQVLGPGGTIELGGDGSESILVTGVASTFSQPNGGTILVRAPNAELMLVGGVLTTESAGPGGLVDIDVRSLAVRADGPDRAAISSSTFGSFGLGDAGRVEVDASESIEVVGNGGLASATIESVAGGSRGDGGEIEVSAPRIALRDGGTVANIAFGSGAAGDTTIRADELRILGGSSIDSSSLVSGAAGDVIIEASRLLEVAGASPAGLRSRVVSATAGTGAAGRIDVRSPGGEVVVDSGLIATTTVALTESGGAGAAGGRAGNVAIEARNVRVVGGGVIDSSSLSPGEGGRVDVTASESIRVGGAGSSIASRAAWGRGGDVNLSAPLVEVVDGGQVESTSDPDVGAAADAVAGLRGTLVAPPFFAANDAGSVRISADRLALRREGSISTSATGRGDAGSIDLDVTSLEMEDGATVASQSFFPFLGAGQAGDIVIGPEDGLRPTRTVLLAGSRIETSAATADGGDITARVSELLLLRDGSAIDASDTGGEGGRVRIATPRAVVLRDGSEILARAAVAGGAGGLIEITADAVFQSPDSQVIAENEVIINSPETQIEGSVTPLDASYLAALERLGPSCASRAAAGPGGSFTVSRHRGLPVSPEEMLIAFEDVGGAPLPGVSAGATPEPTLQIASSSLAQGAEAFRGGRFEDASRELSRAADLYQGTRESDRRLEALQSLAQAQQAGGRYAESVATLAEAAREADARDDPARAAALHGSLGNAWLALGDADRASAELRRAIDLARETRQPSLVARLLNNRGNLETVQGEHRGALRSYLEAASLARAEGLPLEEARSLSNAARASIAGGDPRGAAELGGRADELLHGVPASRDKAFVLIHLAQSRQRLAAQLQARWGQELQSAHASLLEASAIAGELGDTRSRSWALGLLGSLYLQENRTEEALWLTRRALSGAEEAGAPDLLYRWHWQAGRAHWANGEASAALQSYRRAVIVLEETRQERFARYGSAAAYFRRAVAPVYVDFVDALLQGSGLVPRPEDAERLLLEARATTELLKAAELRDYFQDECIAEVESRQAQLDAVSRRSGAAVVYPIVLPDRTEILVSLPSGIERHTVAVDAATLRQAVADFRRGLLDRLSLAYREPAERLHAWLVAPFVSRLSDEGVGTLVFVPDGALRTVPMAALHDGERFLAERYAVAVTPGLSLVDPQPLDAAEARMLLAGISDEVQGFAPLPGARREIEAIHALYGGKVLLDEGFESSRFEDAVERGVPSVVHVASHAVFTGDPATSFVLTHDDRLTMDRLAEVVAPTQFRERPLELLTLSACETAAGDERAALGLAGVAIRAGARSALGSLWAVQDDAATELVVGFYEALKEPDVSKAEALRRSQARLIRSPIFGHPFYWSPYLLVSNWL